jgi:anoctamin-8
LKGADDLQLEKPIKQEFGGGYKVFLFDELEFYEGKMMILICSLMILFMLGVQDEEKFFNSQERQSIVRHLLYSIRMNQKQEINGIKFKVDQSLSKLLNSISKEILFFFSSTWVRKTINSTSYSVT